MSIEWAAGLLEGEGSFSITVRRKGTDTGRKICRLSCVSTDKDVMDRLAIELGAPVSKVKKATNYKDRKQPYYIVIQRKADLLDLLPRLLPHMGKRRSESILKIMDVLSPSTTTQEKHEISQ